LRRCSSRLGFAFARHSRESGRCFTTAEGW
jgi:hypothetical protein